VEDIKEIKSVLGDAWQFVATRLPMINLEDANGDANIEVYIIILKP